MINYQQENHNLMKIYKDPKNHKDSNPNQIQNTLKKIMIILLSLKEMILWSKVRRYR